MAVTSGQQAGQSALPRWRRAIALSSSFVLASGSATSMALVGATSMALVGAIVVCPEPARASTFLELTLSDLVARSTSVVVATPLESSSVWEDSPAGTGRRIVTYTRVKVSRVLDGAPLEETWVRTLGGQVGNIGQRVDGDAVLVPQRTALLFLRALPDGPHAVVGMGQGHYPLDEPQGTNVPKILVPRNAGRLLPNPTAQAPRLLPAHRALGGKTVDEAAELIAAARRADAP